MQSELVLSVQLNSGSASNVVSTERLPSALGTCCCGDACIICCALLSAAVGACGRNAVCWQLPSQLGWRLHWLDLLAKAAWLAAVVYLVCLQQPHGWHLLWDSVACSSRMACSCNWLNLLATATWPTQPPRSHNLCQYGRGINDCRAMKLL